MKLLFVLCLFGSFATEIIDTPLAEQESSHEESSTYSKDGLALVGFLKAKGFDCHSDKPTREKGHRCVGRLSGYPDKINFYIPPSFNGSQPFSMAYHIHGYRLGGPGHWSDPFSKKDGEYGKYLTQSKKNALLIVPEGRGKNATHKRVFGNHKGAHRFFQSIEGVVRKAGFSQVQSAPIALSGHSGAYDVMHRLAPLLGKERHSRVHGVALFDSMYGYRSNISKLFHGVKKNQGQFYIAHNGRGKKVSPNRRLLSELKRQAGAQASSLIFYESRSYKHMSYMRRHMPQFFEQALP